jgi:hypothetical protein
LKAIFLIKKNKFRLQCHQKRKIHKQRICDVFSTKVVSKTQTTLSSTFTNLKTWKPNFWKELEFFRIYFPNILKAFFLINKKQVSATLTPKTQKYTNSAYVMCVSTKVVSKTQTTLSSTLTT